MEEAQASDDLTPEETEFLEAFRQQAARNRRIGAHAMAEVCGVTVGRIEELELSICRKVGVLTVRHAMLETFGQGWRGEASATSWRRSEGWLGKLAEYGNACAYCGDVGVELTRDHVVPDGPDDWSNIVPSCLACNAAKGRDGADVFRAKMASREYRAIRMLRRGMSLDEVYRKLSSEILTA